MNLTEASQFSTVNDVMQLTVIFRAIIFFSLPFLILSMIIYVIHIIRLEIKKRKKMKQLALKAEQMKNIASQQLLNKLNNISFDTTYNTKYDSLTLEFDTNGKIV